MKRLGLDRERSRYLILHKAGLDLRYIYIYIYIYTIKGGRDTAMDTAMEAKAQLYSDNSIIGK